MTQWDSIDRQGHFFVVQGDLTELYASDLLIPCDTDLNVSTPWQSLLGDTRPARYGLVPTGTTPPSGFNAAQRTPLLLNTDAAGRRVWLINTGGRPRDVKWLLTGLRTALDHIGQHPGDPHNQRQRRLIALPMLGTGQGGFRSLRAEVIDGMTLALADASSANHAPDVALVVPRRADYAAFQNRRPVRPFPLEDQVARLAKLAKGGGLVLFIGAGASSAAGLPSWTGLLSELARRAGRSEADRSALSSLPAPDQAEVIAGWLGTEGLTHAIEEIFADGPYAMAHALLASLRLSQAVTTNYDTRYEHAARRPFEGRLRVLPREQLETRGPWLLKLHGDVRQPGSVVLSREQYMRFDTDSAPLASIVQAKMVTSHMLFVGYSLSDENFIRLARQVRAMYGRTSGRTVGTVLSLTPDRGREELWGHDLTFVNLAAGEEEPEDGRVVSWASRRLEILLDHVAREACGEAPYFLDDRYEELQINRADVSLRESLKALASDPHHNADTPAWGLTRSLLADLGLRPGPPSDAIDP